MIDVITLVVLVLAIVAGASVVARDRLHRSDIKQRYAVTLKGGEGTVAGLVVEESWRAIVLENCVTVPERPTETPQPIAGRVHVDRVNIAYRQELSNDPV